LVTQHNQFGARKDAKTLQGGLIISEESIVVFEGHGGERNVEEGFAMQLDIMDGALAVLLDRGEREIHRFITSPSHGNVKRSLGWPRWTVLVFGIFVRGWR
jgi:hypothetical protein